MGVCIVGWAHGRFGRHDELDLEGLIDSVSREAIEHAGVAAQDIDAMWLRDSTAQIWPYLPFMKTDPALQNLVAGVIHRQTRSILKDPSANAFYDDESKISEWKDDLTDMKPGIHERKWEIDSLCYPIRLAYHYWKISNDATPFNESWKQGIQNTLRVFKEQQRKNGNGPYTFQRNTFWATDGVPLNGYGYPVKPVGLICSVFRPSDDATIFPFLIPSNFFAVVSLKQAAEMTRTVSHDTALSDALLDRIQPRLVIVTDSQYPASARASEKLHERLEKRNLPVLYTRSCGSVMIDFTPIEWTLRTMSGQTFTESRLAARHLRIVQGDRGQQRFQVTHAGVDVLVRVKRVGYIQRFRRVRHELHQPLRALARNRMRVKIRFHLNQSAHQVGVHAMTPGRRLHGLVHHFGAHLMSLGRDARFDRNRLGIHRHTGPDRRQRNHGRNFLRRLLRLLHHRGRRRRHRHPAMLRSAPVNQRGPLHLACR